jgi:hypothetical protein
MRQIRALWECPENTVALQDPPASRWGASAPQPGPAKHGVGRRRPYTDLQCPSRRVRSPQEPARVLPLRG